MRGIADAAATAGRAARARPRTGRRSRLAVADEEERLQRQRARFRAPAPEFNAAVERDQRRGEVANGRAMLAMLPPDGALDAHLLRAETRHEQPEIGVQFGEARRRIAERHAGPERQAVVAAADEIELGDAAEPDDLSQPLQPFRHPEADVGRAAEQHGRIGNVRRMSAASKMPARRRGGRMRSRPPGRSCDRPPDQRLQRRDAPRCALLRTPLAKRSAGAPAIVASAASTIGR